MTVSVALWCHCALQETTLYGATVKIHEPVGVIGIACPDEFPLLAFVSLFAPAVIRGNAIVIVPSETHPLLALDLYQVLLLLHVKFSLGSTHCVYI